MTCKRTKMSFVRRRDSTSGHYCSVPHCTASATSNSVVSFHTFPKDEELLKQWLINIRRENLVIKDNSRVCNRHFRRTDLIEPPTAAGRRRLRRRAVPVLFSWNGFAFPPPRPGVLEQVRRDHDYCAFAEVVVSGLSVEQVEELHNEIARLREHIEDVTVGNKFCVERFAASDADIRFFTRFASHAHLMAFWKQIEPVTHKIVRVTRARRVKTDEVEAMLLQPIDEFFLFMTYLSLGLMQKDLAHRFKIHQSAVSRIISIWANFLYSVLGAVGIWLDAKTVQAHLPDIFQDYPDTQVLLDWTELRCQTPNSHRTFKGLIGMAPHGAVTFVSSLCAGSIGDKEILKQSGIVALLNPSMAIMVDKGFFVDDCVTCKVHRPTFLSKRAQLYGSGVRKTQSTARLQDHVERLIGTVKEHKIFSTVVPLSLTDSINQLYTVACLLVNYQSGPLDE